MRKYREWISLHFLILSPFPHSLSISSSFPHSLSISSFSLHFLAARLQGCNASCSPAWKDYVSLHKSGVKAILCRAARIVAALQPGCEEMEREWGNEEEMEREWGNGERDSLSRFPHSLSISSPSIYFLRHPVMWPCLSSVPDDAQTRHPPVPFPVPCTLYHSSVCSMNYYHHILMKYTSRLHAHSLLLTHWKFLGTFYQNK